LEAHRKTYKSITTKMMFTSSGGQYFSSASTTQIVIFGIIRILDET